MVEFGFSLVSEAEISVLMEVYTAKECPLLILTIYFLEYLSHLIIYICHKCLFRCIFAEIHTSA